MILLATRSAVATSPVVERAHLDSNPSWDEQVSHGVFPHICFVQVLDIRVALQWDYDVPVVYEARVASMISRRTFEVYRL